MFIASVLQEFRQQYLRFRCPVGMKHARVQICPVGTSGKGLPKGTAKCPMHLNLNKNRKYCCNLLNNFHLRRFSKRTSAFRCSEKQEHLNSAKMQIQALNMLIASVLQEFQLQYPRFRCSVGMKHARIQTCPVGTSGKGLPERHCKTPNASEPGPKPQKLPQLTE